MILFNSFGVLAVLFVLQFKTSLAGRMGDSSVGRSMGCKKSGPAHDVAG
ncbi:hypothetical protein PSHT_02533 [Puccinia striiformis]|uniref:Uncharacterized protein n=2 Tax=Puccinia striiformis TaxID=27350 RepID=A0A2S4VWP1_9BASI|nr:hypothetical protein PSTT_03358 [Puccinia striiformis]POW21300.1 hypothetical protein PSHT_02533 [Puccinia striiformis]